MDQTQKGTGRRGSGKRVQNDQDEQEDRMGIRVRTNSPTPLTFSRSPSPSFSIQGSPPGRRGAKSCNTRSGRISKQTKHFVPNDPPSPVVKFKGMASFKKPPPGKVVRRKGTRRPVEFPPPIVDPSQVDEVEGDCSEKPSSEEMKE